MQTFEKVCTSLPPDVQEEPDAGEGDMDDLVLWLNVHSNDKSFKQWNAIRIVGIVVALQSHKKIVIFAPFNEVFQGYLNCESIQLLLRRLVPCRLDTVTPLNTT